MNKRLAQGILLGSLPSVLLVSGIMALAGEAAAQTGIQVPSRITDVRRGETVTNRARPDYDPLGVRAGGFVVLPSLRLDGAYNDNIFSTNTNEQSDLIATASPTLVLQSDWGNHMLRLQGGADIGRYLDNDAEDFEDYDFNARGRVDVTRRTKIRGGVGYRQEHVRRSSPDDVAGVEPTIYDVLSANIEGSQTFNRLTVSAGGAINRFDYDDVAAAGGITINNDDRDRDNIEGNVKVAYEVTPRYQAFVRGAYNVRNYESAVDDNGVNRDSDGYEVVVGVSLDFGGITFGDFYAGYRAQDYDDPRLNTASGPVVGADVTWNVTPLTTVVGSVSRVIRESTTRDATTGAFASGRFFTTVGVTVDHELKRNVLLAANASASQDDFEGINRTDEIYRAGVGAKYLLNRYASVGGEYRFRMRNSDVGGGDFTENQVLLRVLVQY
jgi:hypothetical protein